MWKRECEYCGAEMVWAWEFGVWVCIDCLQWMKWFPK